MENHEYLTVKQITQLYPFSLGQIRHFLQFRHRNSLQKAVLKVGKRLILRRDLWEYWLNEQKENREFRADQFVMRK